MRFAYLLRCCEPERPGNCILVDEVNMGGFLFVFLIKLHLGHMQQVLIMC